MTPVGIALRLWALGFGWLAIGCIRAALTDPVWLGDLPLLQRFRIRTVGWVCTFSLCALWPLTLPMTWLARHDARRRLGLTKHSTAQLQGGRHGQDQAR